ncbi:MAG: phospholipid carrier-dependent glycosyltransferase [Bacilli bacterium]|nr:phospholipid carrier-dependent glycosyltransferase [Bacilli bacterium]
MKRISKFLDEEEFNYKDFIILGIIVLFYSILSFINLGTTKAPQTFYKIDNKDGITIKFKSNSDINRIIFYNGEEAGEYKIELSEDGKKYNEDIQMTGSGAFSWDTGKLNKKAKYIRIKAKEGNLILGEIAFYDNSNNKMTCTITHNKKQVLNLTDEALTVPERISHLNSSYFDEVYFARSAYDYANNKEVYDWVHPPLGKMIESIPIKLSGKMAPFYYRVAGNIFGILIIVVMYLFGKLMFKKRKYACLAALLMTFDTLHFAQTRIGTIDSYLTLFVILEYYFMFRYIKYSKTKDIGLSGLFFALAASVKWSGLWSGIGLCIIYIINKFITKERILPFIGKGITFFIVIPVLLYTLFYISYPNINNIKTTGIKEIVYQSKDMYKYHHELNVDHPYASKWYTWPVSYKPVWYYTNSVDATNRETIVGIGNIMIWWPAIITFLLLPYYIIKKKNKKSAFLLIAVLSMYLPYAFISRPMFLYHYFIILPFMMLSIVNFFYQTNKNNKKDILMLLYLVLIITTFIIYYPVISGVSVSNDYIERTKILSSWEY